MKASERYYEILKETLENAFHGQTGALETAAQRIAESLLNGGMLYTFGTGHGHLLAAGNLLPRGLGWRACARFWTSA